MRVSKEKKGAAKTFTSVTGKAGERKKGEARRVSRGYGGRGN